VELATDPLATVRVMARDGVLVAMSLLTAEMAKSVEANERWGNANRAPRIINNGSENFLVCMMIRLMAWL
jgi:hypothetical protein